MMKYMIQFLLFSGALYGQPNEVELPALAAPAALHGQVTGLRQAPVRLGMTKAEEAQAEAFSRKRVKHLTANAELILGAFDNNVKRMKKALEAAADINAHGDYHGYTPLIILVTRPDFDPLAVQFLLSQRGLDLDAYDDNGMTALHHAAQNGNVKAVDLLVYGDASLHLRDKFGRTPLYLITTAIKKNAKNPQLVAWLKQAKQIIEDKDDMEKHLKAFAAIPQEEIESQINDDKWHTMTKKLEEFRSSPEHMARYTPEELASLGKEEVPQLQ